MTTPSHTELAARLRARAEIHKTLPFPSANDKITAIELEECAAALESPERVQGEAIGFVDKWILSQIRAGEPLLITMVHPSDADKSTDVPIYADQATSGVVQTLRQACEKVIEFNRSHALAQYGDANKAESWSCVRVLREALSATPPTAPAQYSLPDELYESKDWKAADYAGRVEWLHAMYEAKKKELESFLSMATKATAPAQDAQGEAYKLSDEDINEGAERHGITVAGPRLEDFDAGVRWAELVLANPPDAATPSPQAEKQPLSEADEALMRQALEALRRLDGWLEVRHLGGLMPDEKALTAELAARLETSNV